MATNAPTTATTLPRTTAPPATTTTTTIRCVGLGYKPTSTGGCVCATGYKPTYASGQLVNCKAVSCSTKFGYTGTDGNCQCAQGFIGTVTYGADGTLNGCTVNQAAYSQTQQKQTNDATSKTFSVFLSFTAGFIVMLVGTGVIRVFM